MRCDDCGEGFADREAFDLHVRPWGCDDPRLDLRYRVTNRGEWSCRPFQPTPAFPEYQLHRDDHEVTYG